MRHQRSSARCAMCNRNVALFVGALIPVAVLVFLSVLLATQDEFVCGAGYYTLPSGGCVPCQVRINGICMHIPTNMSK
jgi:hypothetical protein